MSAPEPKITTRHIAQALYNAITSNAAYKFVDLVVWIRRGSGAPVECRGHMNVASDQAGVKYAEGECQVEVPQDAQERQVYVVYRYQARNGNWYDLPVIILDPEEVSDAEKGRTIRYRVRIVLGVLGEGAEETVQEEQQAQGQQQGQQAQASSA